MMWTGHLHVLLVVAALVVVFLITAQQGRSFADVRARTPVPAAHLDARSPDSIDLALGTFAPTPSDDAPRGAGVRGTLRTSAVLRPTVPTASSRTSDQLALSPAPPAPDAVGRAGREKVAGLVVRPFVVFISGHAGSTWLCSLLASHPSIVAKGEIFNKVRKAREGLQDFWSQSNLPPKTLAAGFKIRPWALGQHDKGEYARAWDFIEAANASVVCNCREMIANAVSRARASYRNLAEFYDKAAGKWRRPAFDLPEDRFADALKGSIRRTLALFAQCKRAANAQLRVLWVSYAALLERKQRTGEAVLSFLGLPPANLSNSRHVAKYGSTMLNATVLNIERLIGAIANGATHARLKQQLAKLEASDEYRAFCTSRCAHEGVDPAKRDASCVS